MKLAALFAKFLYQHRELRLPGLGIFTLDPSIPIPDSAEKNYYEFTRNIQFQQKPVTQADEKFIDFIRTETGKIRPLAESDLDSFLSDGKILLNIGKPFHIEGIGYLQKNREGKYEFTAGDSSIPKIITPANPDLSVDEPVKQKAILTEDSIRPNNTRKLLIGVGAVAGIVLVIWLGYGLYNRNTASTPIAGADQADSAQNARANSILDSVQSKIDSTRDAHAVSNNQANTRNYRFIIEKTANRNRAYRRLNQIKENLSDVKLESRDSTLFSLYFIIPAQPADTARIRDSLKIWYGRKRVWIEPAQ